jgi:formylmethanofuran dehydrogenase subunit B
VNAGARVAKFKWESGMEHAWIVGQPATLDTAVAEAAKLLSASRYPLIAGLGTDVAGARATIALAKRTGAVIDHLHSDTVLRGLEVIRSCGVMLTTPSEMRVRADTLLLVGAGLNDAWPQLPQQMFATVRQRQSDVAAKRRILWLCPGRDSTKLAFGETTAEVVGKEPRNLPTLLATLRARVAGRPTGRASISSSRLGEISNSLKTARFGVAIWSTAALDALTIEMVCGLVDDLNASTRFSALPLGPADNAMGVMQACGWTTGFPMRTAFGRGFPEHDPWLFDSRRLVDGREVDCVIWISAYRAAAPAWREQPPMIALTAPGAAFPAAPRVHIEVGRPGVDHAAVQHLVLADALVAVEAKQPSDRISVADAITRIASALPGSGERLC